VNASEAVARARKDFELAREKGERQFMNAAKDAQSKYERAIELKTRELANVRSELRTAESVKTKRTFDAF